MIKKVCQCADEYLFFWFQVMDVILGQRLPDSVKNIHSSLEKILWGAIEKSSPEKINERKRRREHEWKL